jgi:hypothetical protein
MKLKKFHACPNHYILYQGAQYENLQSCLHYGASRYKKNVGCCTDDEEGASRGPKKMKNTAKKQPPSEDDEEEGYTQRKSPACRCGTCSSSIGCVHYSGTQRMPSSCPSMHQLNVQRMMASCGIPLMASSGSVSTPSFQSLGTRPGMSCSH